MNDTNGPAAGSQFVGLTAAGDHPRVVVTVNGRDVELDLAAFTR